VQQLRRAGWPKAIVNRVLWGPLVVLAVIGIIILISNSH